MSTNYVKISVDLFRDCVKQSECVRVTTQTTRPMLYRKLREILDGNVWDEVDINIAFIEKLTDVLTKRDGEVIIKK